VKVNVSITIIYSFSRTDYKTDVKHAKEEWLMTCLTSLIKREDEKAAVENVYARGLNIFDNNVHKVGCWNNCNGYLHILHRFYKGCLH